MLSISLKPREVVPRSDPRHLDVEIGVGAVSWPWDIPPSRDAAGLSTVSPKGMFSFGGGGPVPPAAPHPSHMPPGPMASPVHPTAAASATGGNNPNTNNSSSGGSGGAGAGPGKGRFGLPPGAGAKLRSGFRWLVGGYLVYSFGSTAITSWRKTKEYLTLPPSFWLDVDLERQVLVERPAPLDLLRGGGRRPLEVGGLMQVLRDASEDRRCCGLLAVLGGRENFGGLAQLQELRAALLEFKAKAGGRAPLMAYSNAFGEGGSNATAVYFLASAFDGVYTPPTSMVSLLGFEASQVFIKQLLERAHITADVFRREEYKAAATPLTNEAYDEPQRANMTALLESLSTQVVKGIASGRKLPVAAVAAAINEAPLSAPRALELGLVDGLLYRDQVEDMLTARARELTPSQRRTSLFDSSLTGSGSSKQQAAGGLGSKPAPDYKVDLTRYTLARLYEKSSGWMGMGGSSSQAPPNPKPHPATAALGFDPQHPPGDLPTTAAAAAKARVPMVVVVHATGTILQAAAGDGLGQQQPQVDSHRYVRALRWLRRCPQVAAVVLRISSPGGSAVASDVIAREVGALVAAGKPVVASFGDVAASGGYYIAAPCNKILAQPATLTGSIGVIMARFNVRHFLGGWGVTHDSIKVGDNADWTSPFADLAPAQRDKIEEMIDATYGDFMGVVAKGRRMGLEEVRGLAKGRVYTGQQALEVGLVDEVGGLGRALEVAREAAGLSPDPAATITAEWPTSRITPLLAALGRLSNQPDLDSDPSTALASPQDPSSTTSSTSSSSSSSGGEGGGGRPSPTALAAVLGASGAGAGVSSWSTLAQVWLTAAVASGVAAATAAGGGGATPVAGALQAGLAAAALGAVAGAPSSSSMPAGVGSDVGGLLAGQQQLALAAAVQLLPASVRESLGWWWGVASQPGPQCASLEAALLAASC